MTTKIMLIAHDDKTAEIKVQGDRAMAMILLSKAIVSIAHDSEEPHTVLAAVMAAMINDLKDREDDPHMPTFESEVVN